MQQKDHRAAAAEIKNPLQGEHVRQPLVVVEDDAISLSSSLAERQSRFSLTGALPVGVSSASSIVNLCASILVRRRDARYYSHDDSSTNETHLSSASFWPLLASSFINETHRLRHNFWQILKGAGLLGLPYGYARAGWLTGSCLLVFSGIVSCFTMHLLSIVSRDSRVQSVDETTGEVLPPTFFRIAKTALPTWGCYCVEVSVILNCFGLATSYLVVIGSTMPFVVGNGPSENPEHIVTSPLLWTSVALLAVTPLAFAPTLESLNWTSLGGVVMVFYITAVVIAYASLPEGAACRPTDDDDDDDDDDANDDDDLGPHCGGKVVVSVLSIRLLRMLSIATFAFTAHVQLLSVSNELRDYTQKRMDAVSSRGVLLCGSLYAVVGLLGYLTFGEHVQGNLLLGYPSDPPIHLARVGVVLLVGISYPLMAKPARDSALGLLPRDVQQSDAAYVAITAAFLLGSYAVAMSVVDYPEAFSVILDLLGSTCSTTIAYIVPPAVYTSLYPEHHLKGTLAFAVLLFGCCVIPTCTMAIFV